MIRVMVAYAVYFVEGRLRGFDGRGLAHQTLGSVIVALEEGECSAGIDSLGGVAGATKVAFGGGVVASLQGSIGGVDVGYLVVGIHTHGGLKHLVEFVAAGLGVVAEYEELAQREA